MTIFPASLFFLSYETTKKNLIPFLDSHLPAGTSPTISHGVAHMISASFGEIAACTVRVPAEVIKQRAQASQYASSISAFRAILANNSGEGVFRGLYRGWTSTILREIPFTAIQFPLYEWMKTKFASIRARDDSTTVSSFAISDGAIAGSIAGGIAAFITTPLDVLKTRLMLHHSPIGLGELASKIVNEDGYRAFWRGAGPRTLWISAGGAIFLGTYEIAKNTALSVLE